MSLIQCEKCRKWGTVLNLFEGHWLCNSCHSILYKKREKQYYQELKKAYERQNPDKKAEVDN